MCYWLCICPIFLPYCSVLENTTVLLSNLNIHVSGRVSHLIPHCTYWKPCANVYGLQIILDWGCVCYWVSPPHLIWRNRIMAEYVFIHILVLCLHNMRWLETHMSHRPCHKPEISREKKKGGKQEERKKKRREQGGKRRRNSLSVSSIFKHP